MTTLDCESVSALRALTTATYAGSTVNLLSWWPGKRRGGDLFFSVAGDTTNDDGGTVFIDASHRHWHRDFDGTVTPYMFGALSGVAADQSMAIDAMHKAINSNPSIDCADVTGRWNINGGPVPLTKDDLHYGASGRGKFKLQSDKGGLVFKGINLDLSFVEVDGGGFDGSAVVIAGNDAFLTRVKGHNCQGQGISIAKGVDGYVLDGCEGYDTGKAGIGIGKAKHGMVKTCRTLRTGTEGIAGDEVEDTVVTGCFGRDTRGIAFIAMDKARNVSVSANLGYRNHNGFASGDNKGSSQLVSITSNVFTENDKCGIWLKNKFARANIKNISRGLPCIITYDSKPVLLVTKAMPTLVKVIGHGKFFGDRVVHHNIVNMTKLNGVEYVIKPLSPDTYELYDTDSWAPIDTRTGPSYGGGGTMDHAFVSGDRQRVSGALGMTQINFDQATELPAILVGSVTNNTVTLVNEDGTPYDTRSFGAWTSGGVTERGGAAHDFTIFNNITTDNVEHSIYAAPTEPVWATSGHIIYGNKP